MLLLPMCGVFPVSSFCWSVMKLFVSFIVLQASRWRRESTFTYWLTFLNSILAFKCMCWCVRVCLLKSEYDQEISQSYTVDQPTTP